FSSRRRHTRFSRDWSSDVCSSDLRARLRREHEERTRALRERNIERYSTEQVDPAWAPQKISELTAVADNEAFQTAGAKPQSLSVDCRTSMCRIDGQFENSGKAEDWILMYMRSEERRVGTSGRSMA